MDDLLVYALNEEDHLKHLNVIFGKIRDRIKTEVIKVCFL